MCGSMVDIQSTAAEIRRGKKERRRRRRKKKPQGKNIRRAAIIMITHYLPALIGADLMRVQGFGPHKNLVVRSSMAQTTTKILVKFKISKIDIRSGFVSL